MNNLLGLIGRYGRTTAAVLLIGVWLLFARPVGAADLHCDLAETTHINPAIINTMLEAADKGYFYSVDTGISNVAFQVNHFPFSTVKGQFREFQGGLALPGEADQSRQVLFLIKANSMSTGDNDLDDYLKSTDFFNTAQYPDIVFISTGFEWINESTARLYGELTLRGKTKPLVFNVKIHTDNNDRMKHGPKMTLSASAHIQRSDFGMHRLPLLVSDTVRFSFQIQASRVSSQI